MECKKRVMDLEEAKINSKIKVYYICHAFK